MKKSAFFFALFFAFLSLKAESYDEIFARFAEVARIDEIFDSLLNEQYLAQNLEQQIALMGGVEFSQKMKDGLLKAVREVLQDAKPEYDKYIYEVYKKHYTQGDLRELIAFYSTDVGKKTAKLQGILAKEGALVAEQIFAKYQPLLMEKLQKLLESK